MVQFLIALYFLYRARAYLEPILAFLAREEQLSEEQLRWLERQHRRRMRRDPAAAPQHRPGDRTEHLVKWISRSAAFMIANSLCLVVVYLHYRYPYWCAELPSADNIDKQQQCSQRTTPGTYLVVVAAIFTSRLAVSYTQVGELITPRNYVKVSISKN